MEGIKKFTQYIERIVALNESETEFFHGIVSEEHLPKNHIFLGEGQYCKDLFFLYSGVVWIYKPLKDDIVTLNIFGSGSFLTDLYGVKRNLPTEYNFKTLRPCTLLRIKYSDIIRAFDYSPTFERLLRIIYEETLIKTMARIHEILFYDVTQRYQYFVKTRPELVKQVPQKYIASYLDITPETLSRIRKGKS